MVAASETTRLLEKMREGDSAASEALIPLLYRELRAIAAKCLKSERHGHTLQPTVRVHDISQAHRVSLYPSRTGRTWHCGFRFPQHGAGCRSDGRASPRPSETSVSAGFPGVPSRMVRVTCQFMSLPVALSLAGVLRMPVDRKRTSLCSLLLNNQL